MNNTLSLALSEIQKVIIGKEREIKLSLAAFFSSSHMLIEDIPGVGKTTLAKTLAHVLGLSYSRIQFTNDLLASDIIGVNYYNTKEATFTFKKGAIFTEFLLADEINRASSKTQSALLEAMEERQVSVDGTSYELSDIFFVIATKNPFEEVGTYELPSSQLDRFAISISLGYPDAEAERTILLNDTRPAITELEQLSHDAIKELQADAKKVHVDEKILDLLQEILRFTRESGLYEVGLSTRAALSLVEIAKAWAMIDGREFVIPDDLLEVLPYLIHHRLSAKGEKKPTTKIVDEIVKSLHIDT